MSETRTIKVVKISVSSIKGYSRWVYRTVECNVNQRGYRRERGVRIIWESDYLYRPNASRGKGPAAKAYAEERKQEELTKILGLKIA